MKQLERNQQYLDDSVLDAARAGGDWAWTVVYHDLAPQLRGYVRGLGADADADDIVSDVFVSMVRSIDRFKGGVDEFRAWAYAIARNARTETYRRASRRPLTIVDSGDIQESSAQVADSHDDAVAGKSRVMRLLSTLTNQQREVMVLRIVGDLTIAQIAYVLGEREASIKALQRRAIARLKESLEAESVDATS